MARATLIILFVMMPLLFSCSMHMSATSYQDRSIPSIPLSASSSDSTWESSDLKVTVRQSHKQSMAVFTGELTFDNAVVMSFPLVERFSMRLLLQDQYGSVLKREALHLGIVHYQFADKTYTFKLQTMLPENATRFTFEYEGSFSDYGEIRPDSIYIAYHPPQPSAKPAK